MSALLEDSIHHDRYFYSAISDSSKEALPLRVLEWFSSQPHTCVDTTVSSAAELFERDSNVDCKLRIVLAPSGPAMGSTEQRRAFQAICHYYDVPSAFLSEHFTSPAYSFGKRKGLRDSEIEVAWTRFLCKDVLAHPDNGPYKVGSTDSGSEHETKFYDNFLWIKCIPFLHVRDSQDSPKCVTMICFGGPPSVEQRFERLLDADAWEDAVQEPYILFALIYEQLFLALDKTAWTLASWFRPLERSTLDRARFESAGKEWTLPMDFAKLHEIAKHGIYLSEAATAATLGMENVISHLRDPARQSTASPLTQAAISQLQYTLSSFRSTSLRLSSLDKRIANVISLSFNLVTQQDSRILTHDSNAMKAIALLTLIFLPMTGVASLFDTPFFEADDRHIRVSSSFWIFWVVTICLTVALVVSWLWWYKSVKLRAARRSSK